MVGYIVCHLWHVSIVHIIYFETSLSACLTCWNSFSFDYVYCVLYNLQFKHFITCGEWLFLDWHVGLHSHLTMSMVCFTICSRTLCNVRRFNIIFVVSTYNFSFMYTCGFCLSLNSIIKQKTWSILTTIERI